MDRWLITHLVEAQQEQQAFPRFTGGFLLGCSDKNRPAAGLIEDARMAVKELDQQDIFTYCINLDPKADEYVADIFGKQYTPLSTMWRSCLKSWLNYAFH